MHTINIEKPVFALILCFSLSIIVGLWMVKCVHNMWTMTTMISRELNM